MTKLKFNLLKREQAATQLVEQDVDTPTEKREQAATQLVEQDVDAPTGTSTLGKGLPNACCCRSAALDVKIKRCTQGSQH